MATSPAGTEFAGSGVSSIGRSSRGLSSGLAISATAGRFGASCKEREREACTRLTPGSAAERVAKSGGNQACSAMAPLPAVRAYRSAGSTLPSQSLTPVRKLATITVKATDKARLATTPATAAVAVRR